MKSRCRVMASAILAFCLIAVSSFAADSTGAISGKVIGPGGEPATDARIALASLRKRLTVDAQGTFNVDNVPPGEYLLEATSPRLGSKVTRVTVVSGQTTEVTIEVDVSIHREEVTVTASVEARTADEVASPVSVLSGHELQSSLQATLGETLNKLTGVNSTFYGQGASRPVIRGLGGDRIAVLQDGLNAGDVSTTSPDHAVTIETMAVERVEVLRGPATLLYGSSAVGGAVNVIDDTIPALLPSKRLEGFVDLGYGSNSEDQHGSLSLAGGAGPLAWHLHGSNRDTGNYSAGDGVEVANSLVKVDDKVAGLSWVGKRGFIGASIGRFDSNYGNPAEEIVTIDMQRTRYELRAEIANPFAGLRTLRLRAGKVDYQHTEFEGSEAGTTFTSDGWEARVDAAHQPWGPLRGSFGLQIGSTDLVAVGAEGFIPFTKTDELAAFLVEEVPRGTMTWQFGGRYEQRNHDSRANGGTSRDLSGASASAGLVIKPNDNWSYGLSLARSSKLPNAEELFSNGPHAATGQFEIGDVSLDDETSIGADFTVRKLTGRVTGEASLFYNRFTDFIYERPTGEFAEIEIDGEIEELPIVQFSSDDATFLGAEIHSDIALWHTEPHHLSLELTADYVRAELDRGGNPPRIPPMRCSAGLHYAGTHWWVQGEVRRTFKQSRNASYETPTAGFTFFNTSVGYRFFLGETVHDLLLRASNLADTLGRNHTSFLKDVAPLPGRDVSLSYRVTF
ncbi:MAG: TonB-dependent receptor [Acidobacteriota bacterium]